MAPGKRILARPPTNTLQNAHSIEQPSAVEKRVRGGTRGLGLNKTIQSNGRIKLTIHPNIGKPICSNSTKFANECGVIVRNFVPPTTKCWNSVSESDKEALFHRLLEKFDLDLTLPHVQRCCNDMMGARFRNYRYRCHLHFLSFPTRSEAEEHEYNGMRKEDWKWLCEFFSSPDYQRNLENGNEPSRIDLFYSMHYKAGKGWISEEAEEDYTRMRGMQIHFQSQGPDDVTFMTDGDICDEVLGRRSGYVKGLGYGPKPPSSASRVRQSTEESIELREKLEEQQQKFIEQQNELATQQVLITSLQEENKEIRNQLKSFHEMMAQFMGSSYNGVSSSSQQGLP